MERNGDHSINPGTQMAQQAVLIEQKAI